MFRISGINNLNKFCQNLAFKKNLNLNNFIFKNTNFLKIQKFTFAEDTKEKKGGSKNPKTENKNDNKNEGKKDEKSDDKKTQNKKGQNKESKNESNIEVVNKESTTVQTETINTTTENNVETFDDWIKNGSIEDGPIFEQVFDKNIPKVKVPLKNEKYQISHNYEKKKPSPKKEKQVLDNLVTQMLRNEEITSTRAQEIKTEIRDPLNTAVGRHLNKIQNLPQALGYIQNFSDMYFYRTTFDMLDRLIKLQNEQRSQSDPSYIQIRSQHKLVTYDNMTYEVPEKTDVRQNVNSKEWLKTQPRVTNISYSYNIEQNWEFYRNFQKFVDADKKKTVEKQKLLKYIKLNPDNQQVKLRFIPKHLPNGITPDMIPDFNVDISNYKPTVTKKSRRKFNAPRIDTDFTNYQAWRCFDRVFHSFSVNFDFLKVEIKPKFLINRFGPPGMSQHPGFTGMYYFEDENLDFFMIGDFEQTQFTWGPDYTDAFYKEQEDTVKPEWHVKKWPSLDEFWESTELKEFRIYYPRHSECKKFKRWLKFFVNSFDVDKDKTMDQILDEKFGPIDDYSDYNKVRTDKLVPAVYHYSPKFFMSKTDKVLVDHDPFEPPLYISPKDGEMFDYEDMLKEEAKKGIKHRENDELEGIKDEEMLKEIA